MMTTTDPEVRIRYLTLSLFAQSVIDALIAFVEQGNQENLDACLSEAVESLRHATGAGPGSALRGGVRAFGDYEHVRTLEEVRPQYDLTEVIKTLEGIRQGRGNRSKQKRDADKAIAFFGALQNQALRPR
jgi:hypothetical protein